MRTTIIAGFTAIALLSPSLSFAEETPSPQGDEGAGTLVPKT